jgi:hypothetical protein
MIGEKAAAETLPAASVQLLEDIPLDVSVLNICCIGAKDATPELATVEAVSAHA